MSTLLPPNATFFEKAFEQSFTQLNQIDINIRSLNDPNKAPAEVLPWLAWERSIDSWDTEWTEEQKRAMTSVSYAIHQKKGTVSALKKALDALGYELIVQEWYQQIPADEPYTFTVHISNNHQEITPELFQKLLTVITANKNLRSHLKRIKLVVSSSSVLKMAAAITTGQEIEYANIAGSDEFEPIILFFSEPYNLTVNVKQNHSIESSWDVDGVVDEQHYYCSENPITPNDLPSPKAILTGSVRSYIDVNTNQEKTYYIRFATIKNGVKKISNEQVVNTGGDQYWSYVTDLLRLETSAANSKTEYNLWSGGVYSACPPLFGVSTAAKFPLTTGTLAYGGASSHLNFSSRDFTIEGWVHPTEYSTAYGGWIYSKDNTSSTRGINVVLNPSGKLSFSCVGVFSIETTELVPLNTWTYFRATRSGSTFTLRFGETALATATSTLPIPNIAVQATLGQIAVGPVGSTRFTGFIREIRITDSVGRSNYSIPTGPFYSN